MQQQSNDRAVRVGEVSVERAGNAGRAGLGHLRQSDHCVLRRQRRLPKGRTAIRTSALGRIYHGLLAKSYPRFPIGIGGVCCAQLKFGPAGESPDLLPRGKWRSKDESESLAAAFSRFALENAAARLWRG